MPPRPIRRITAGEAPPLSLLGVTAAACFQTRLWVPPMVARSRCLPLRRRVVSKTPPLLTLSFLTVIQREPCFRWMRSLPLARRLAPRLELAAIDAVGDEGEPEGGQGGLGAAVDEVDARLEARVDVGAVVRVVDLEVDRDAGAGLPEEVHGLLDPAGLGGELGADGVGRLAVPPELRDPDRMLGPRRRCPAFSAPRRTLTTRPRSGVEASSWLGPDFRGPPPVLSIGWWAKTSNIDGAVAAGGPLRTWSARLLAFFFFLLLTGLHAEDLLPERDRAGAGAARRIGAAGRIAVRIGAADDHLDRRG